jgi:transposase-like protein
MLTCLRFGPPALPGTGPFMKPLSFKRHRFPADVVRYAVWLYFRFTLSFRDVEELLAERGIEISYETIRAWTIKFGPQTAENLKARSPPPSPRWHLDEMACAIGGKRMYLWHAVDDEGEVLDMAMRSYRDMWTAAKFLANLIGNQPTWPERIDRRAWILRERGEASQDSRHPSTRSAAGEQQGREFSSADPTTRAEDAEVQVADLSPALPRHSRSRLQHLIHPATSHQPLHPAPLPWRGFARLERSYCGLGRTVQASSCLA